MVSIQGQGEVTGEEGAIGAKAELSWGSIQKQALQLTELGEPGARQAGAGERARDVGWVRWRAMENSQDL